MKTIITMFALAAGAFAVAGQAQDPSDCCKPSTQSKAAQAQPDTRVLQKATITVKDGFSPSSINVKAGKQVQLTFDVKSPGCATQIVFKDLNIRKSLTTGKKTIVTFTPKTSGKIDFACQMGMYKGAVVVRS